VPAFLARAPFSEAPTRVSQDGSRGVSNCLVVTYLTLCEAGARRTIKHSSFCSGLYRHHERIRLTLRAVDSSVVDDVDVDESAPRRSLRRCGVKSTVRRVAPYALAVASVAAALSARFALDGILGDRQAFAMFYVAVAMTAWFGGVRPALAAIALGCFAGIWFFLPPRGAIGVLPPHDALEAGVYAFVGVVVTLLVDSTRRAQRRATEEARRAKAARAEAEGALAALSRIQAVTEAALADLPLDVFLDRLVTRVRDSLRTDAAVILMDENDSLRVRAAVGLNPESHGEAIVAVGKGFAGSIAREGRPLVWQEADIAQIENDYLVRQGIRALAGVPLLSGGRVFGVLHVAAMQPRKFRDDEVRLLQLAGERVALGLERTARADAERRARAEAEAANRAKDEFVAMLAHELRNPLAAIHMSVRLQRLLGPPHLQLSQTRTIIDRQVTHMVRLVDDLLDVVRIARGKIVLQKAPVRLADLVTQAVEAVRPLIDSKAHDLRIEMLPESLWVEADGVRIVQAISNLLTNAAKFTPTGGTITMSTEQRNMEAFISVCDTGVGIAAEALERIFEPFVQGDVTLNEQHSGLGVGLSLAKRLVEMHGGRLTVRSAGKGAGSEFTLAIPATAIRLPLAASESKAEAPPSRPLSVLIVEDNTDIAECLTMHLQFLGHRVQIAHDGPTALRLVTASPLDVMLVDIGLPGMSGYEIARRMRAIPSSSHAMMIALTGYAREEDRRRALDAGFDHHLVKPFDIEALQAIAAGVGSARGDATSRATVH
jgi:K+-sensing histidine kinase KdpD/ActR/RegA family two-component response regulator